MARDLRIPGFTLTEARTTLLRTIYRTHPTAWVNVDVYSPRVNATVIGALVRVKLLEARREGRRGRLADRFCRLTRSGLALMRRLEGT